MQLSQHFHLNEFTQSNQASRLGIDNTPPNDVIDNLIILCELVLEPIRNNFDAPVRISSGYRCPALNAAIGSAPSSQHITGQAADIEITEIDNCHLASWIEKYIEFDQLILEFHDHAKGPNDGWVHVSFNNKINRRQVLTAKLENGKTVYYKGLT